MAGEGSDGMYIDCLVNETSFVRAFCDSGCQCYGTVSEHYAKSAGLTTFDIKPRKLQQLAEVANPPEIRAIARFTVDMEGFKMPFAAYVVPGQEEDMVLGLGWMQRHRVTLQPEMRQVTLNWPFKLSISTTSITTDPDMREISANALKVNCTRLRKQPGQGIQVFSASMADIQKTLEQKQHRDPKEHAPEWLLPVIDAFDRAKADVLPPHRPGIDHAIEIEDGKTPPTSPLYSMSKEQLLVLRKTLTDYLDKGFIRASSSPCGAPVIFVKKPGGGLRFCVDYRGLNALTRRDKYPLPLIDETLRMIAQAKWISKVDVIQAFHRVRVREGDEWKTTFNTRLGAYEWLVTPFGLSGGPSTFQRRINDVLREWLDVCCSAYLDDVVIYSNGTRAEHRELVRKIVKTLGDAGLQLDFEKSEFEAASIKYLGFIIEAGIGIKVDPEKVRALREWEPPTTVRGVRAFLGFANFYRTFVNQYSKLAAPLNNLTRKDTKFVWRQEHQESFDALRDALMNAPILAKWDPEAPTTVEADSSGYVIGAVLSQQQSDGLWRPVAYSSKKLSPAESNWPIHDKEMWAVISAIRQWNAELQPTEFTVYTDHKNLEYFRKKQRLNERQLRWSTELAQYHCSLVHRAGAKQVLSDALSRRDQDLPKDWDDDRLKTREKQVLLGNDGRLTINAKAAWVTNADWDKDGELLETTILATQDRPASPFGNEHLSKLWEEALMANKRYWVMRDLVRSGARNFPTAWGLPISISECKIDEKQRLCWRDRIWIPAYEKLRTAILQKMHDSPLGGHPGREALRDLVSREYTWPNLTNDVRQFVRNCDTCNRAKVWREQTQGLLKPLPIPERPWQELSMDFIVTLPTSNGCTNILVVTDRLSKSCILIPMSKIDAETVAQALIDNVFAHHHLPRSIVSDRGTQFVSMVWAKVCEKLNITRRLSTAFHPQTDGATERMNAEVEVYLRCFCSYAQTDWAPQLPIAMMSLNNRTNQSIGMSPFLLTHGFHGQVIQPSDEVSDDTEIKSPVDIGNNLARRWKDTAALAQASMASAQDIQERHANKHRRAHEKLQVGDRVYLNLRNVKTKRTCKKLDWISLPYHVMAQIGTHTYRLDVPPGIHDVFHTNLLRRAAEDPLPSQELSYDEPVALQVDGFDEYEVEEILRHRRRGRGWQVLVQFRGWPEPTWEPVRELMNTSALVSYEQQCVPPWQTPREE